MRFPLKNWITGFLGVGEILSRKADLSTRSMSPQQNSHYFHLWAAVTFHKENQSLQHCLILPASFHTLSCHIHCFATKVKQWDVVCMLTPKISSASLKLLSAIQMNRNRTFDVILNLIVKGTWEFCISLIYSLAPWSKGKHTALCMLFLDRLMSLSVSTSFCNLSLLILSFSLLILL